MKLLTKIINYFSGKETNLDWKVVALDLHRALIEAEEKIRELEEKENV